MRPLRILLILVLAVAPMLADESPRGGYVAHEWGTFTSFQDEGGNAISRINIDDEPVPDFVHKLGKK